jgi:ribosomal protein S27E
MKVQVKRVIKPELTYGMFSVALLYLFQGIGWFAFLTMMKRPSPEEAQGPPMARDRYGRPIPAPYPQAQQDSRGLPPEAYYDRGPGRGPPAPAPGPYGARGAAAGAGAGYGRGPPQAPPPRDDGYGYGGEQEMGPPPMAQARGRPAGGPGGPMGRPGPGPAGGAVAVPPAGPPRGKIASIKCPRCRLQFTYERTGGPQTIRCPNCGKEGRIGAKKGAPGAAPAPARPPAATRPQVPAKAAPAGSRPPAAAATAGAGAGKRKNIRCPQCKQMFEIVERPRPFDIECPHCGKKGRLK